MANPALIIRVAANLAELKANLAEGKSQIETTTAAMGKLAASFSGDKLIQAAHNVTAAVQQMGGVSKLTDAEMGRVNATLEKALDKYRALGKEAPAGMRQLADDTRQVDTVSNSLGDTVKSLVLSFAAMFTARAAFNFVSKTIDEASSLKDLSQQVHINVEELQLLAGGMSEFGVDAAELGNALFGLSRKIAGGDESVAHGLHQMGLSLKDVDGLEGKELFLKIMSGLSALQGGLRDTAATDLFGSKLGAAMAGASEGIEGTLDTWSRLNTVISTESVDALDEYGEAIDRMEASLSSMAANMIGPVAQGFNTLVGAAEKGASKWAIAMAAYKDYVATQMTGTQQTGNLTALLLDLTDKTDDHTRATVGAATAGAARVVQLTAQQQAVQFMAAIEKDAAVTLDNQQLKNLAHLKELGALTAQNAAAVGVNAAQFKKYTADVALAEVASARLEAEFTKLSTATGNLQDLVAGPQGINPAVAKAATEFLRLGASQSDVATAFQLSAGAVKTLAEALGQATAAQKIHLDQVNAAVIAEFNAQVQLNKAMGLDAAGALQVQTSAAETLRLGLERLAATAQVGVSQKAQAEVLTNAFTQSLYDEAVALDREFGALRQTNDELAKVPGLKEKAAASIVGLTGTVAAGATQDPRFNSVQGRMDMFREQQTQYGAGGAGAGIPMSTAGMFAGMPTPGQIAQMAAYTAAHRADGGPVSAGQPYWVGERGRELFTPAHSGSITPNGGGSGGGSEPRIIQLVVDGRVLASVLDTATMNRQRDLGTRF